MRAPELELILSEKHSSVLYTIREVHSSCINSQYIVDDRTHACPAGETVIVEKFENIPSVMDVDKSGEIYQDIKLLYESRPLPSMLSLCAIRQETNMFPMRNFACFRTSVRSSVSAVVSGGKSILWSRDLHEEPPWYSIIDYDIAYQLEVKHKKRLQPDVSVPYLHSKNSVPFLRSTNLRPVNVPGQGDCAIESLALILGIYIDEDDINSKNILNSLRRILGGVAIESNLIPDHASSMWDALRDIGFDLDGKDDHLYIDYSIFGQIVSNLIGCGVIIFDDRQIITNANDIADMESDDIMNHASERISVFLPTEMSEEDERHVWETGIAFFRFTAGNHLEVQDTLTFYGANII